MRVIFKLILHLTAKNKGKTAFARTSLWLHLRCDVGLEAEIELQNCLVLCIVMFVAEL